MIPTEQSPTSTRPPRVSLDGQVKMRPTDLGEIRHALAGNLSLTGMFVRAQQPYPAGSFLQFELTQGNDLGPVKGLGQVAWVRFDDEGPVRPAGMGLRFRWIEPDSRDTLLRLVDPQGQLGGEGLLRE